MKSWEPGKKPWMFKWSLSMNYSYKDHFEIQFFVRLPRFHFVKPLFFKNPTFKLISQLKAHRLNTDVKAIDFVWSKEPVHLSTNFRISKETQKTSGMVSTAIPTCTIPHCYGRYLIRIVSYVALVLDYDVDHTLRHK